jgi:hypothetical protein
MGFGPSELKLMVAAPVFPVLALNQYVVPAL